MIANSNHRGQKKSQLIIHNLSPRGRNSKHASQFSKHNHQAMSQHSKIVSNIQKNDRLYQAYSLQHLIQKQNNLLSKSVSRSSFGKEGEIVRLIYAHNNSLHLDSEFLGLMQKYSDREIGFVMVYGRNGAGKSFLCDQLIHLAGGTPIDQNKFQRQKQERQKKISLNTWSVPFQRQNLKIFLLDIENFLFSEYLSPEQQMLLDAVLLLSSAIIILPEVDDRSLQVLRQAQKHFRDRMSKLVNGDHHPTSVNQGYWPQLLYCAFRSPGQKNDRLLGGIQQIFKNFNFVLLPDAFSNNPENSIKLQQPHISKISYQSPRSHQNQSYSISQQYLRNLSILFRDIYHKIKVKEHSKLKYTGRVVLGLVTNMVHFINQRQKYDDKLNVQTIYNQLTQELYISAYNYQLIRYNQKLQQLLQDEQPKSTQQLIEIFKQASDQIVEDFTLLSVSSKLHEKYWQKLLRHIDEKEKIILQINHKKSKKKLMQEFNRNKSVLGVDDIKHLIWDMKTKLPGVDQGRTQIVGNKLKNIIKNSLEAPIDGYDSENEKLERVQNRKQELQQQLKLMSLRDSKRMDQQEMQYAQLQQKGNILQRQVQSLRSQVKQARTQKSSSQIKANAQFLIQQNSSKIRQTPQFILNNSVKKAQDFLQQKQNYHQQLVKQYEHQQNIRKSILRQGSRLSQEEDNELVSELKRQVLQVQKKQEETQKKIQDAQNRKKKKGGEKRSKKSVIK